MAPRRRSAGRLLAAVACIGAVVAACSSPSPAVPATHTVPASPVPTDASPTATSTPGGAGVPEPAIVAKPIPFPDSRKQEMLAYAQEHYGLATFHLVHPQAIVEHFTATATFAPVFSTFASNAPDLGELPGTCAHFVIDTGGTIYQLVPLDIMCRHTVGLNWTAIGIEMVGTSDQDILGNPRQLDAALSLTVWLMTRFGIQLRNVIGHNESLTTPLRRERVASFLCQTHADWNHADMVVFRGRLAERARRFGVAVGPTFHPGPVPSGC
jgi:N-acetylmuramoyl-L-alanine amidase